MEALKVQLVTESALRQEVARERLQAYRELVRASSTFRQIAPLYRNNGNKDATAFIEALDEVNLIIRLNEHILPASIVDAFNRHTIISYNAGQPILPIPLV